MAAINWTITENQNAQYLYDNLALFPGVRYICGQLEQGTNLHFQGYLQLDKKKRMSWLKKNISHTAHFEVAKGSPKQNIEYCSKDDTRVAPFKEFGVSKGQGTRTDINTFKDAIKQNTHIDKLIDEYPMMMARYPRFYNLVKSRVRPPPRPEYKVSLFMGKPGTGKTTASRALTDDYYVMPITNGTIWFDGYCGQEVAILDDYNGQLPLLMLLRVLHDHIEEVPIKGGHAWWYPKHVIITTNYHPRQWYKWEDREDSYAALARRFHEIKIFLSDYSTYEEEPLDFFHNKITSY